MEAKKASDSKVPTNPPPFILNYSNCFYIKITNTCISTLHPQLTLLHVVYHNTKNHLSPSPIPIRVSSFISLSNMDCIVIQ